MAAPHKPARYQLIVQLLVMPTVPNALQQTSEAKASFVAAVATLVPFSPMGIQSNARDVCLQRIVRKPAKSKLHKQLL